LILLDLDCHKENSLNTLAGHIFFDENCLRAIYIIIRSNFIDNDRIARIIAMILEAVAIHLMQPVMTLPVDDSRNRSAVLA
jgi:hypothetical protein